MLMLFVARKVIFWLLFIFKSDSKAFEKVKPKLQEEIELHKKVKEMNKLIARLEKIKEELNEQESRIEEKKKEVLKVE